MNLAGLLIPISLFAMVFGIVYIAITSNHRQKIAMIEAGMNPNEKNDEENNFWTAGFLFVFVPLGIIIGNVLAYYTDILDAGQFGILGAFLFGGLGLLVAKRQNEKKKGSGK
jgi:NADH:ubiquinone oxidoreductase subunit 3 (subunit A)